MITTTTNFQAESKRLGDIFEDLVENDLSRIGITEPKKNITLRDVGVEVDFAYTDSVGRQFYIEAKGGESGKNKRPGARRTDNVKKAIANGALIKAAYPDAQFLVYFSELPKFGSSSHKMIKNAVLAGYIDGVRYLIKYE
jgi:hypothetical protein